MKKKLLMLGIGLLFVIPAFVAANSYVSSQNAAQKESEKRICQITGEELKSDEHCNDSLEGVNGKMLEWAGKYTPDQLAEWKMVIEEKNSLQAKWQSPEMSGKRDEWRQSRMEAMTKLHKKLEDGELTKAQLDKKMAEMREKFRIQDNGNLSLYNDLQNAVKEDKKAEVAGLLNKMLDHFKEQNKEIQNRIAGNNSI